MSALRYLRGDYRAKPRRFVVHIRLISTDEFEATQCIGHEWLDATYRFAREELHS